MKPIGAYVDFTETHNTHYAWLPKRTESGWVWLDEYIVVERSALIPGRAETRVAMTRSISKQQWLFEKLKG